VHAGGLVKRVVVLFIAIGLFSLIACVPGEGSPEPAGPVPPGYRAFVAVEAGADSCGAIMRVEVLEDERLASALGDSVWGTGFFDLGCENDSLPEPWASLCASVREHPLLPAVVRAFVDGRLVGSWPMTREQARLGLDDLRGDGCPTFVVTEDRSVGWGSYAGPRSRFLELRDGRARWLRATDARTGRVDTIEVASSLKNHWQTAPAGAGKDVLVAQCRPDFDRWERARRRGQQDDTSFVLVYTRYHFDGRSWVKRSRTETGYSDFEDGFPDTLKFPR
jgi:hypothetical protein